MGGMATHHVQIVLTRASRRPRAVPSLPAYAGILTFAGALASLGVILVSVRVCGLGWRLGALFGLAAAAIAALCAAAVGARISQALTLMTRAVRELALGCSHARLPSGPVSEIARLSSALDSLAISMAGDGKDSPDALRAARGEPTSAIGPR